MKEFIAPLLKALTELVESINSKTDISLDEMAYEALKPVFAAYESAEEKSTGEPQNCVAEEGMMFDEKLMRHYCMMSVKFERLDHGKSAKGTPFADFSFEVTNGTKAGEIIHHKIFHTLGRTGSYDTENVYVRRHLGYTGEFRILDCKDKVKKDSAGETLDQDTEMLNESLPGKYLYTVAYFPPEGEKFVPLVRIAEKKLQSTVPSSSQD